jgi:hypothetical protein
MNDAVPVATVVQFRTTVPTVQRVMFTYTNYRGETTERWVAVTGIEWGNSAYHNEPQWLLRGIDLYKMEERVFAMRDMQNIRTTL